VINHCRTLLLNKDGATRPASTFYLEEYVPPLFTTVEMPGWAQTLRKILFGDNPDDAFLNFRMKQFMSILHSTEYVSYVTDLDSRVTYQNNRSTMGISTTPVASPITAQAFNIDFEYIGQSYATRLRPLIYETWTVDVTGTNELTIINARTGEQSVSRGPVTDGLSEIFWLPGLSKTGFRIQNASFPDFGAKWLLTMYKETEADILELENLIDGSGEGVQTNLFIGGEPYKTFKQLWDKHAYFQYRLSGVLLALTYRTETVRTRGN